ncbi:acyl-homoserine-lactone acylase [Erythrobacter sp. HL-111]|nr:MAG: acyl-homoserine-lactone acylase [Erythrobacteraceae bacterium HL-111]SDS44800.1 acyl-homoserine-lactone acylase [Erythrobacter sp. HL-111]
MRAWLCVAIAAALMAGTSAAAEPRYAAEITRTAYGIPHIVAKDWRGLGYGIAYAYAEDNLCLLAEQFATLAGERSLHFGPDNRTGPATPDWTNLESDIAHRALFDLALLRANWDNATPRARLVTEGYVAGYNRYLRDAQADEFPAECRGKPWLREITLDDMLRSYGKLAGSAGEFAVGRGILAVPPETAPQDREVSGEAVEEAAVLALARTSLASNGWGFGGNVTTDGRGLLVGNPHYPWVGPRRFWQMHATIPGEFDVMGAALSANPYPMIGFNRDIAWTHTVDAARHFTLHALTLDPEDPTAYILDGERVAMERREISIPMPEGKAPVTRTVHFSRFGPIVALPGSPFGWSRTTAYALSDANRANMRMADAWIGIGRARDVGEIAAVLGETLGIPWANTIAADRAGNALHADITAVPNVSDEKAAACATPVSALVAARVTVLDGSRSDCAWDVAEGTAAPGLLPPSAQASTIRRDYLANSNDSYWLGNPRSPHPKLAAIMGDFETERSPRTRSNLLETEAMIAAGKVDRERAKAMLLANRSFTADNVLDTVIALCRGREELARGCDALARWDRRFDTDSRGAYLFARMWNRVWSMRAALWQVPFDPADPLGTPRELVDSGPVADKLMAALEEAVAELDADGIALDAEWGTVQAVRIGEEVIPVHGGTESAGVLNMQWLDAAVKVPGGIRPIHGSSYIQVVGFDADGPVADAVLTYSQSSDPASPHFADQTRLFAQKKWVRLPFDEQDIAAQAIGETIVISQ